MQKSIDSTVILNYYLFISKLGQMSGSYIRHILTTPPTRYTRLKYQISRCRNSIVMTYDTVWCTHTHGPKSIFDSGDRWLSKMKDVCKAVFKRLPIHKPMYFCAGWPEPSMLGDAIMNTKSHVLVHISDRRLNDITSFCCSPWCSEVVIK